MKYKIGDKVRNVDHLEIIHGDRVEAVVYAGELLEIAEVHPEAHPNEHYDYLVTVLNNDYTLIRPLQVYVSEEELTSDGQT